MGHLALARAVWKDGRSWPPTPVTTLTWTLTLLRVWLDEVKIVCVCVSSLHSVCFCCLPVSISFTLVTYLFSSSSGLSICGHNCLLTAEWMSASKIVCRVGPAKDDKGEIIVTTKSGGLGTSTVSFKLLRPERIGETYYLGALSMVLSISD